MRAIRVSATIRVHSPQRPPRSDYVISPAKSLICATLLAIVLLLTVAQPHPAQAAAGKTPCWKVLLNDWYDGRIDGTYPVHCYKEALKHLPTDVSTYSSARDDILRALQSAKAKLSKVGHKAGPNTLIVPPTTSTKTGHGKKATTPGRKTSKGLGGVAAKLNPSGPSSLPLPLLVLGGLGILLVAGGGAGLVVKRVQRRRPGH